MIKVQSYVGDAWVDGSGKQVSLIDPTSEAVIGQVFAEGLDLPAALTHAREVGGPALRAMTFAERGVLLRALSKAIHGKREELIEVSIKSGGTTRSDAKFDIDGASGTLAYYASLAEKLGATRTLVEPAEQLTQSARFVGRHVWTTREGVALHINAFNFPAWGLGEKLAVAFLAGVPVVTKPATSTSILAFHVVQALVGVGALLPKGALQFVAGSVTGLVEHLGAQDHVAFTGSADTGQKLRGARSVIERSVRVNIEADSLNSSILALGTSPSDDVYRTFIRDVTKELTQKTGQKCTATRRIFVPAELADQVASDLGEELQRVKVGDPSLDEVRMGPLATKQQRDDFRAGIGKLVESGAKVIVGSPTEVSLVGVTAGQGFFVGPVLLRADRPHEAHAVHAHEVFGPAATLMPYTDAADVAKLVARGQGGLVASIYGEDRDVLKAVLLGVAPYHGRVLTVSAKIADQAIAPGLVLPSCVHGGPGRAGGGEELGGERGLRFYMQRTAVQGDRALLDKIFDVAKDA